MFGKFGDIKKAMELKSKVDKFQKNLKKMRIEEEGMGGKIRVVVNGAGEVVEIKLSPELFSEKPDIKKIEKTLTNALNAAQRKAAEISKQKMQELLSEFPPEVRRQLGLG